MRWLRGLGAASFGAALLGMAAFAPPVAAQPQKTLRAVVHADLKVLDPTWTTIYITNRYGYLVYDTLFSFNAKSLLSGQSPNKFNWL